MMANITTCCTRYRCMSLRKLYTIDGLDGSKCKYFGKWPFQRIVGVQELFSVAFSLANLAAHAHNLYRLHQAKQQNQCFATKAARSTPAWGMWTAYALGSINAWWWSAVFHSRDTYLTERLDYLSADVSIVIGLYVSICRVCGLMSSMPRVLCMLVLSAGTAAHFWYMLFVKFDYGFNVKLCILVGVLQQVMWCSWAVVMRHPSRRRLTVFVLLINAALSLEVLDFPPIAGLLDAHALWHLCTVPLIYMWYSFVFGDIEWVVAKAAATSVETKQL